MVQRIPATFGSPTREHVDAMREASARVMRSIVGISVPSPAHSTEAELISELRSVMRHVACPTLDPVFSEAVDLDMVSYIASVVDAGGESCDEEEMREVIAELEPVVLRIKYRFNLPRPWQVASAIRMPLWRLQTQTAETPAYPSGHALQAAALCAVLSRRFPALSRPLIDAASRIGRSRLELGLHFPSDVLVGLRLGRQIGDRLSS